CRPRGALQLAAALLAVALAAAETTAAARLVARQAEEKPAVYQLADYLRAKAPEHAIVYTWEEERVLNYLDVPAEARPIFTYAYFVAETEADPNARILLTDSVLRGFRAQADIPDSRVKKLATFRSDSRLDPVYGTLTLYEWVR
ncbi:nucleoporin-interacting protein, partial [Cohnella xylanilytica]|nr:nucleoporin-interacting protein [Cohnella xylanilytica]